MLQIELLGPVDAHVDGRPVALGGQRPRALFAVLALMGGRVVTSDALIDELWGDEPPARARESLQMHVSRLRRGLADAGADSGRLVSRAGGYLLDVEPTERDVDRWARALGEARRARQAGDLDAARAAIDEALGLWRGEPFGGGPANGLLAAHRGRLEEERLGAIIEGIELDLELGRHRELLGQLDALVFAHPFKERLVELQMLALYRSDRQADALAAFQAARGRFVDELGIEPAQPLRELHEEILRHSPELVRVAARPVARGLPTPPNRTIGRARDVDALGERLRSGGVRLLTLTGPGGVGKTRLAVESARAVEADFADGACFVSLAAVARSDDVPAAIIAALGIVLLSGETATQAVERFLSAKHALLVADNLEHLPGAAPFIGALLSAAPGLTVLATSREPLALQAEQRYPVSPLALDADAVALFRARARAHDPSFDLDDANRDAVAEICRRVDGLPLGIELAAARCGLLSPAEIAERLDAAMSTPGAAARDAPARQQTLRAAIEWSHELLSGPEQACFAHCAVFAGGATVDAAEAVTGADLDTLEQLVAKSLLVRGRRGDGATRLSMLATIRAYATERLAADADAERVRERHYDWFLAIARRHGQNRALKGRDGAEHAARLTAENDDLAAALEWAIQRCDARRALAMVGALGWFWLIRDRYAEAVSWIDRALSLPGADAHPALLAAVVRTKAKSLWALGRGAEQPAALAALQAIGRRLDDPVILSQALQGRANHEINVERLDVADALADEALRWARTAGDAWEVAEALRVKAIAASTVEELRERVDAAASRLGDVGNIDQLAHLLTDAAFAALCLGADRDASDFAARATPAVRALDRPFARMIHTGNVGLAALVRGDTDAAAHAFREELGLCRDMVIRPVVFEGLRGLAAIAVLDGDAERAATLVGAADAHRYDHAEDAVDVRLDATFFEPARIRCGSDVWNAAVRAGSGLSFDDAIAYALEEERT